MRAGRTRALAPLAALVALAGPLAACGGETGPAPSPSVRTVPPAEGDGGSLPPPVGVASPDGVRVRLRQVATVDVPVALATRPGTSALHLAEKAGRVVRVDLDRTVAADGAVTRSAYHLDPEPVLDLTAWVDDQGERGLLGLAFSPDGAELYTYATDRSGMITLDAWGMAGDRADPATRRALLRLDHPRTNHNGGQLVTDPDGRLYLGVGDGGGAGDPDGNGQDPHTPYGAILRIDPRRPDGDRAYGIPADNPYADGRDGAPEVWAWGLRNPWRFSFDRHTGDLWIGDVGQDDWEEIDFLPDADSGAGRGANLGWSRMEGTHPFGGGTPPPGHRPPIFDYSHEGDPCSVTGGYVYRGATHPDWQGAYLWADYCTGRVHALVRRPDGRIEDRDTGVRPPDADASGGGSITSFGEDADGELYVLSATGGVHLVEAA